MFGNWVSAEMFVDDTSGCSIHTVDTIMLWTIQNPFPSTNTRFDATRRLGTKIRYARYFEAHWMGLGSLYTQSPDVSTATTLGFLHRF